MTPAMQAGVADELRDLDWVVDLIEINTPPPAAAGAVPAAGEMTAGG